MDAGTGAPGGRRGRCGGRRRRDPRPGLDAGASARRRPPRATPRSWDFSLQLEQVQEGLYRAAAAAGRLDGPLREYVAHGRAAGGGARRLPGPRAGGSAGEPPRSDFSDVVRSPERFHSAAIDLEELAIAAYIGQGANLTRRGGRGRRAARVRGGAPGRVAPRPRRRGPGPARGGPARARPTTSSPPCAAGLHP